MQLPYPDQVTTALIEAGEKDVLPRFRSLQAGEVLEKKPGDVVTVADIEAEERLSRSLPALLPGSVVVGEEAHHRDPEIINHLDDYDAVWLVDPVDGTGNFVEGRPIFCLMAALVVKGEPAMAWIHDPITRNTVIAEKGSGAFLNHVRITVPEPVPMERMIGQINLGYFDKPLRGRVKTEAAAHFGQLSRLRCAGQDYANQALGRRHFALYRYLWSWDHVPGVLILREAGGYVSRMDGDTYRARDRVHGLLSAPNEEVWHKLSEFFRNIG